MDDIDILVPNELAQHRSLAELRDELIEKPEGSFRQPPGKTSADSEYQPVYPQVRNKQHSVQILGKKFLKLAACSRVDDQPGIESARTQQIKVPQREKCLATETRRGMLRDNTDFHITSCGTKDLVVSQGAQHSLERKLPRIFCGCELDVWTDATGTAMVGPAVQQTHLSRRM
jgi:hypothetical protein